MERFGDSVHEAPAREAPEERMAAFASERIHRKQLLQSAFRRNPNRLRTGLNRAMQEQPNEEPATPTTPTIPSFFREYFLLTAIVIGIIALLICCRFTLMSRFWTRRGRRGTSGLLDLFRQGNSLPDLALAIEASIRESSEREGAQQQSPEEDEAQAYWNSLSKDKRQSILEEALTGTTFGEDDDDDVYSRRELVLGEDDESTVQAGNTISATIARKNSNNNTSSGIPEHQQTALKTTISSDAEEEEEKEAPAECAPVADEPSLEEQAPPANENESRELRHRSRFGTAVI